MFFIITDFTGTRTGAGTQYTGTGTLWISLNLIYFMNIFSMKSQIIIYWIIYSVKKRFSAQISCKIVILHELRFMQSNYMVPVMPVHGSIKPVHIITLILCMVHVKIEFHPVSSGSICSLNYTYLFCIITIRRGMFSSLNICTI